MPSRWQIRVGLSAALGTLTSTNVESATLDALAKEIIPTLEKCVQKEITAEACGPHLIVLGKWLALAKEVPKTVPVLLSGGLMEKDKKKQDRILYYLLALVPIVLLGSIPQT